jgi:hypothetical protein
MQEPARIKGSDHIGAKINRSVLEPHIVVRAVKR